MSENKNTMDVIVHKSNLTMMAGESIEDYTSALSKACSSTIKQSLGISKNGDGSAWIAEAYATKCIVAAYKSEGPAEFYAMTYKRDAKTGAFEFGQHIPVIRKTVYQPVNSSVVITKELGELNGWEAVEKGLWGSII